jgi:peptidyl-prolyl cis-trans isomerase C
MSLAPLALVALLAAPPAPPASLPASLPASPPASRPPADGPVLAEGAGVRVTAADFAARMQEQSPTLRARYATLEKKREFLDGLIRFQVLLAEARRLGLDRDPEVQRTLEKVMVQRLVQRLVQQPVAGEGGAPTDAALRADFDANRGEYRRPARLRVELALFPTERGGGPEAEPEALLEWLAAAGAGAQPAGAGPLQDQGYLTREELAARHGEAVAEAAFALEADGQVAPIVSTPKGRVVLRRTGRQEALERTFEQVREQVAAKHAREDRTREVDATVKALLTEARVRVDAAALARLRVE